jgi:alkylation response protein AidB-like acyl-CoA dehydrogenase
MDLQEAEGDAQFRQEVRAFISKNLPGHIQKRLRNGHSAEHDDIVTWQRILNRQGWATPSWPREVGGPGWTTTQRSIFLDELYAACAPLPLNLNVSMVGPLIIRYGSEEQKQRFLPAIANLDLWFCQGFSEPGAGSDLAAIRTRADRSIDPEVYVVSGQKIWTSTAQHADWMFALVRTSNDGKKQAGLTFLLIDMKTPGITVRPIISIDGEHHLNEVFLDDVRVPVGNRIGEENKGWEYARYLLGHERTDVAVIGRTKERLRHARTLAGRVRRRGRPLIEDSVFCQQLVRLEAEIRALEVTQLRSSLHGSAETKSQRIPLPSLLKLKGTELYQASTELLFRIAGPLAVGAAVEEPTMDVDEHWAAHLAPAYFYSRAQSIFGGTNEIQRNILAKALLEL